MTQKKYILMAVGVYALIVISIQFNRTLYSSLKGGESVREKKAAVAGLQNTLIENTHTPSPENPSKFSIYTQKESSRTLSQAQSDAEMKKSLAQGKTIDYMEAENAFKDIQLTPAEYKQRLDEINSRIKYFEELKKNSSSHDEAVLKLETLYRLKSTLAILKNKIVVSKMPPKQ